MWTSYNFSLHSDIMYAIDRHNSIMCGERLTFLDAGILCLVKSFTESNKPFYMSNQEMKKLFASDPGTIQRSIDRLISKGLITKEKEYVNMRQRRYLIYQPDAVRKFIETYN